MKELTISSIGASFILLATLLIAKLLSHNTIIAISAMICCILFIMVVFNRDPLVLINPAPVDPPLNAALATIGVLYVIISLGLKGENKIAVLFMGIIITVLGLCFFLMSSYNFSKGKNIPWKKVLTCLLLQSSTMIILSLFFLYYS